MRATHLLLAAAATLTLALAGAAAAKTCGPANAKTLAEDSVARVYSVGDTVYGCSDATGKAWQLGQNRTCNGPPGLVQRLKLVGELAGYGLKSCGVDHGSAIVVVRRLSDGQHLSSDSALSQPMPGESYVSVTSLVLKGDGAVAWIARGDSIISSSQAVEVHKHDAAGARRLDRGTAIEPGSLRLSGSTIFWDHGSQTRSATLS